STEKTQRRGHERLSVFGIGTDFNEAQWRSVIRQLVVRGFLRVDHERFGALVLTEQSRPLLRGEISIELREDRRLKAAPKKVRAPTPDVAPDDLARWEALRECRRALAAEHNVPPYVIFHDATLKAMLAARPRTPDELLRVAGVGAAKLDRYGERFLEVLRRDF